MIRNVLFLVALFCTTAGIGQPITFTIHPKNTAQTIDNFGASGAWYSEGIGKYWDKAQKERMAELLFSKGFGANGNPLGIGLSAWRFNIGGGTAEQGDSSGINNPLRRVEGFLQPDGSYDWSKQQGYKWFVQQAAKYGVENLIAFSNTPPVQMTKNGLGFNLQKNYETNLREDKYAAYAGFLTTVLKHFKQQGIPFQYISPVNEPQWDWSNAFGKMNQEGSPWHNKDIYRIAVVLDSALRADKLNTKILLPEAGILTALYEGNGHASRQIQQLFGKGSDLYVGKLKSVLPVAAGHSYFTDNGDSNIIAVRTHVKDTAARYGVPFWQSEYSMLGDGYRDGKKGRIPAMDCALFLAKVIHHDLAIANANAWQLWNAWEPGRSDYDTRYYLLALQTNKDNTSGNYGITKNLWALGHYSRFIRPGMQRLLTQRSDNLTDLQAAQHVMLSAYTGNRQMVVVAINYTSNPQTIQLQIPGIKKWATMRQYITTAAEGNDMKPQPLKSVKGIVLPARSIVTMVLGR